MQPRHRMPTSVSELELELLVLCVTISVHGPIPKVPMQKSWQGPTVDAMPELMVDSSDGQAWIGGGAGTLQNDQ